MNTALLTAAGSSTRLGLGTKKEYQTLGKHSVLYKVTKTFLDTALFQKIVITHPTHQRERIIESLEDLWDAELFLLICGGETRQHSVLNGLQSLKRFSPDYVLIHDAARPWVSHELILRVLGKAIETDASFPAVPSIDAMKVLNTQGRLLENLKRSQTFSAQTPQGFSFPRILSAHEQAAMTKKTYIDDTEIYGDFAGPVYAVEGDPKNRKITYAGDLKI